MGAIHIGIVGSRRRASVLDRKMVLRLVEWLKNRYTGRSRLVLVSGGCPTGADEFARFAAELFDVEMEVFPIDDTGVKNKWEFTQRAFARNRMIAEKSDSLFCFVHSSRTGGTENTIQHALELKKKVFLVSETGEAYLSLDGKFPTCESAANLLGLKSTD
jgi:predicted Rossmann fold nucleotide-binding protein DprA/Smf involved in DNA uptake